MQNNIHSTNIQMWHTDKGDMQLVEVVDRERSTVYWKVKLHTYATEDAPWQFQEYTFSRYSKALRFADDIEDNIL